MDNKQILGGVSEFKDPSQLSEEDKKVVAFVT